MTGTASLGVFLSYVLYLAATIDGSASMENSLGVMRGFSSAIDGTGSFENPGDWTNFLTLAARIAGRGSIPRAQMGVIRALTSVNGISYAIMLDLETGTISVDVQTAVDENQAFSSLPILLQ